MGNIHRFPRKTSPQSETIRNSSLTDGKSCSNLPPLDKSQDSLILFLDNRGCVNQSGLACYLIAVSGDAGHS